MTPEHEITTPGPLLDPTGSVREPGWSRFPRLDCNLENAHFYRIRRAQRLRIKRWDYYGVTHPEGFFSATIADLGYAGQIFVYVIDFASGACVEDTVTIPLGRGVALPRNSDGDAHYQGKDARVSFHRAPDHHRIEVDWDGFAASGIRATIRFDVPPTHESTVVVIPIGRRRFYYNRKINCMPAAGHIEFGDATTSLETASSLGTLDWGRGVWPYRSFWVWASASGFLPDGRTAGLNLGFGFGDTTAATENTIVVDGTIHKLGTVDFRYDANDFTKPWQMKSERVDLEFTPFLERLAKTNLLVVRSEVHQMFGRYDGTVIDDAGEAIRFDGIIGWAEEHHARW
jgi:hypothetical protein